MLVLIAVLVVIVVPGTLLLLGHQILLQVLRQAYEHYKHAQQRNGFSPFTLDESPKKSDIPQQKEKIASKKKSTVRVFNALYKLPGADTQPNMMALLKRIREYPLKGPKGFDVFEEDLKMCLTENEATDEAVAMDIGGSA